MSSHKYVTHVLCLAAVAFTLAPAKGINTTHPNEPRKIELQRAMASFASWAKRYASKSGTITGSEGVEEGISLAKQRRAALRELIQSDPAQALEASVPEELRKSMPEVVASELETQVNGTGDLLIACAIPALGATNAEPTRRVVRLDGQTYRAFVYGWRLTETTKFGIPLHGVVLDGVMAVHESVLLVVYKAEEPELAEAIVDLSKQPGAVQGSGSSLLARLGKTIYRFASLEHLHRSEAMLEQAEVDSPPRPGQTAAELLESGPVAKPAQGKEHHPLIAPYPYKKVLVIRVDFSDMPGDPSYPGLKTFTADEAQTIVDTQVSPFYQRSSYGKAGVVFTVTPNVYRLPRPGTNYALADDYLNLHADAVAAAQADYAIANYDVALVLFPCVNLVPGNLFKFAGLTLPDDSRVLVNGEFDFRVVAHELGHTFGLYHADLWSVNDGNPISDAGSSVDYGDPYDIMGRNTGGNGRLQGDGRDDFNPWFKSMLNWITEAQIQTVTSSGVYRVYRFDDAAATGTLALKVAKDQRTYWIGCRRNFTDNPTMSHGAYVVFGYDYDCPSELVCEGQTPNDTSSAALPLGESLVDPEANLTITVVDEGGTAPAQYIDVQVTFASLPPALHMSMVAGQVVLSWPAFANRFTLESRNDLSAAGSWTPVAAEPEVVGRSLVVTDALQTPAAFYRLHSR